VDRRHRRRGEVVIAMMAIKLVATWLITDWISGFVHWLEDSYGHPDMPIVGRYVTKPNLQHHVHPRKFVTNSWFSSSDLLMLVCLAGLFAAWAIGRLSPMVFFAAALGVNANQVHKWCHRTPRENGPVIVALQRLRFVQSPRQHYGHHLARKDACYCVLTDFLNPVLDRCRFWRALEFLIHRCFGIAKRDDEALLTLVLAEDPFFLGDPADAGESS
jgi:plasmanylethanolamine desaturase